MKLHFEEIVELIHREMYVRNGVMLGSKAAAKAIMQAEEAFQQSVQSDECPHCHAKPAYTDQQTYPDICSECGTRR